MPYKSVADAEKTQPGLAKYSAKAKRGWVKGFNSCMESGGPESKCFAISYSIANKVDGKKSSLHPLRTRRGSLGPDIVTELTRTDAGMC